MARDYWGRPWSYMDAPNGHPNVKANSVHNPPVAHVSIAVLVNCEREPQYLPNLNVANPAAAALTWCGHQMRVIDGSGNCNSKISAQEAARMVQLQNYIGPNVAVEDIFDSWDSCRSSKQMWRLNPEMPRGDVMPETCAWALIASQPSAHRLVNSVPPTQPTNPVVLPAAPHVDGKEYPALPLSSLCGIGGIPGSRNFPKGTFDGFHAFQKPDDSTGVPRSEAGKTVAKSTSKTTVSTCSSVVTMAVPTTSTATSSATKFRPS